ncbi:MAG: cell division topological specificity factor MinE [Anaerolineae bacterium]|nr:cell division topological specificity factor MinE [Anaerolineae bacterium]GIK41213.1 MAG: cell division topological specificity factor [Chloroflexota bacterium]
MNLLNRLLGRGEPTSREIAKDRLRLVLVQDRVNLSAEKMNELKDELIKVISKYVEIDRDGIEIALTQTARQSRLTANIPVVGARQK